MAAEDDTYQTTSLSNMFSTSAFSPEKYVHDLSSVCDTDAELQEHRNQIQALSEDTAIALKKNVYKNYIQFIETSKEISYLEAEMYQLSHLLAEQRALLSAQQELSLFGKQNMNSTNKPLKKEEKASSSIEAVEGLSSILDITDLQCIYEGSLVEIDTHTFQPKQKFHAFLLHDCMVIASSIPNRRGPVRYKFQSLFELENIAVVNVKNSEGVKDAFKILLFPETHIYQTENSQLKTEWLSNIEDSKKNFKLKLEQEVHVTAAPETPPVQKKKSVTSIDLLNPFMNDSDDSFNPFKEDSLNPFLEDADSKSDVTRNPKLYNAKCPNNKLLTPIRQLKIEGATALYITKLSNVFFTSLIETGKEFQKAFAGSSGFCSAFVVWANAELQNFVVRFARQVFHRNIGLTAVGVCVGIASENCEKLNEIGLDLKFSMQHMLLKDLMEALFDCRDQLVAAARQRVTEEHWQPIVHENLTTLMGEMESCGIKGFQSHIIDGGRINLSSATVAFTKSIAGFLEDGLRVNTPELHGVLVDCVADLFKNQVVQFEATLKSSHFSQQRPFILKNASFVLETVLPIVKKKLKRQTGHDPARIAELEQELPRLKSLSYK
ncbi:exocyst complex component 8 [Exaiptasia diaphana]|uniref:Exocyst complex component 8 n=1 Tax=Exaiptasia diaphana TaxID=2652724 RepID=A0A913XMQ1_EXADI|nr:exocyst complex component 8 [Exaiptasia diaphana]